MDRKAQIELILDHYENPRNQGRLDEADVVMRGGNPGCGDVITVYLTIDSTDETIRRMQWEGMGCTISQAAASLTSQRVAEAPLDEVRALTTEDVVDMLGKDVVQSRIRCAVLALQTVKAAVRRYTAAQRLAHVGETTADGDTESLGLEFEAIEGSG